MKCDCVKGSVFGRRHPNLVGEYCALQQIPYVGQNVVVVLHCRVARMEPAKIELVTRMDAICIYLFFTLSFIIRDRGISDLNPDFLFLFQNRMTEKYC
jgi:hypothetical protein